MFPKNHLYLIVRDEWYHVAADALDMVGHAAADPYEKAAILGVAACFLSRDCGGAADAARAALPHPETSYQAVLAEVAAQLAAYRTSADRLWRRKRDLLGTAHAVARFSTDAAWLARLIYETRETLERACGGVQQPESSPVD